MFSSQCLLSRNGPLGAIWVAAYFYKKLKRSQVSQIDISSSVDTILQDEFDVVTYRVLAFLLLGVVRVFSKKVDYLFNDCNEVLLKIRDFMVTNKDTTQLETLCAPYSSITVPERFELDAFDLEILEDATVGHVLPRESNTIKENLLKTRTTVQHSSNEHLCEDRATCGICSKPHNLNEESTSHNLSNLEASRVKFKGELEWSVNSCTEKHHNKQEQTRVSSMQDLWSKSVCEESLFNLKIFSELGQKGDNAQVMEVADETQLQAENHQIIDLHCSPTAPEASMEKLRDNVVSHDECRDDVMFDVAEEPPEYNRQFDEEHQKFAEHEKLLEVEELPENTRKYQTDVEHRSPSDMTPSEDRAFKVFTKDNSLSVALDSTPMSKLPNASGGIITPEFLGVPTPVSKEGRRVSRKRKCLFDDVIVLPNKVVKRYIEDSTDLVNRRKQAPRSALASWIADRVSNLPHCFLEPLIPYTSSELTSLFCQKKSNIQASSSSVENGESLQKLEKSKACNNNSLGETMNVPSFQPPEKVDIPHSPAARFPEQTAIAPKTPLQRTQSVRSFETPQRPEISGLDNTVGYESGTVEKELSPEDQDFDLSFINEDINSNEGDNPDQNGLSARTRLVMKYLNRCFQNRRNKRQEEVVNLTPILEGKTKKKSAMLFYEILELKSKGYVDVKQETAYGEIVVSKSSRWAKSSIG